ncbi:MAG: hypothetical protein HN976_36720 [Lentisphaerae bacterium]|nr:hypothetical protein [Lentisphaerota bacterium]
MREDYVQQASTENMLSTKMAMMRSVEGWARRRHALGGFGSTVLVLVILIPGCVSNMPTKHDIEASILAYDSMLLCGRHLVMKTEEYVATREKGSVERGYELRDLKSHRITGRREKIISGKQVLFLDYTAEFEKMQCAKPPPSRVDGLLTFIRTPDEQWQPVENDGEMPYPAALK